MADQFGIQANRQRILENIQGSFEKSNDEMSLEDFQKQYEGHEVFSEEAIQKFDNDLQKSIEDGIEADAFEKAMSDRSHLVKKVVTTKGGKKQTVYINPNKGQGKGKEKATPEAEEGKHAKGAKVKVPADLTSDPNKRQGQTGEVVESHDDHAVVKFEDGKTGKYQHDALEAHEGEKDAENNDGERKGQEGLSEEQQANRQALEAAYDEDQDRFFSVVSEFYYPEDDGESEETMLNNLAKHGEIKQILAGLKGESADGDSTEEKEKARKEKYKDRGSDNEPDGDEDDEEEQDRPDDGDSDDPYDVPERGEGAKERAEEIGGRTDPDEQEAESEDEGADDNSLSGKINQLEKFYDEDPDTFFSVVGNYYDPEDDGESEYAMFQNLAKHGDLDQILAHLKGATSGQDNEFQANASEVKHPAGVKQGGLSKNVWESKSVQGYDGGHGHLFHKDRSHTHDKAIEEGLRNNGLDDREIGAYVTTKHGRFAMDHAAKSGPDSKQFKQHIVNSSKEFKEDLRKIGGIDKFEGSIDATGGGGDDSTATAKKPTKK